jgi:hypothetical protein
MFRWIRDLWVGSEPVEFISAYGLAESVMRLKVATKRWSFFHVSEQAAVGRVSETRLRFASENTMSRLAAVHQPWCFMRRQDRADHSRGTAVMSLLVCAYSTSRIKMSAKKTTMNKAYAYCPLATPVP